MVVWLAMKGKYEKEKRLRVIVSTLTQPAACENGRK
jgi:hypothetical protein